MSVDPTPPDAVEPAGAARTCAACGATLEVGFAFCESCGAPTGGEVTASGPAPGTDGADVVAPADADAGELSARTTLTAPPGDESTQHVAPPGATPSGSATCSCGGRFEGGWCDTCGAPQPDARDHVVVTLSPTLGCVSDRGVLHHRNEDAGTVVDLGGAVACIVADGVSNVEGSQEASAAAVEATAGVLRDAVANAAGGPGIVDWTPVLRQARKAAQIAAAACTRPGATEAASCTWTVAVTDGTTAWAAWVGDSRLYLVGDDSRGLQLGTDHSWAAEAVAAGADPTTVMSDHRAHMITAWMGADAPELPDATTQVTVEGPGWLLAVSDGLWNYCDGGDQLAALVVRLGGPDLEATELAEALVGFANAAGGADNITVSAYRLAPGSGSGPAPAAAIAAAGTVPTTDTTPGA